ncbi:hypothetical protein Tco_0700659 [Tanacetum coccineum]
MVKTGLIEAIDSFVPLDEHFALLQVIIKGIEILRTDIQEQDQKESQNQTKPSTEWKGQSQRTAETLTDENGDVKIHATIDGHSLSITEDHNFQQHTSIYSVPSLTMKVFSNMKRFTKGFSGQEVALFPTMLDANEPSPSPYRITSSPSPTPSPSPAQSLSQPSPTQPSPTQPSPTQPGTEYHLPTPHDSPLHAVHSHGSEDAYTKLILRVKKLESQVKIGKARKQTRIVISDDEAFEDDSSKQGRKLFNEEVQEKASTETELFIQEVTPTEVIQDQEGSGKSSDEVSTAGFEERRWQKKMHFLLSSMSVVYVLTTPIPKDGGDDATMKQIRKRAKWDNDDYVCRGLILNGMSDPLFDIYRSFESSKEL